jgi:hypothetical protein
MRKTGMFPYFFAVLHPATGAFTNCFATTALLCLLQPLQSQRFIVIVDDVIPTKDADGFVAGAAAIVRFLDHSCGFLLQLFRLIMRN